MLPGIGGVEVSVMQGDPSSTAPLRISFSAIKCREARERDLEAARYAADRAFP
jgi:hypothetical protein